MKLELGALSDPISKQLMDAGIQDLPKNIGLIDRLQSAITLCAVHSIITERERHQARKRLVKMIVSSKGTQP